MTIGASFYRMISGDQHRIWAKLHLIFYIDPSPSVNPTTRSDINIAANFHATRKVNGYSPGDLKISSTRLEARTKEESSNAHDRPKIGQPSGCERNEVEPAILKHSHEIRHCLRVPPGRSGLGCPDGSASHLDFCGTCAEGLSVFRS